MEGEALDRLRAAMAQAADAGVEPVVVPTRGRDAAFLRVAQLAAFATWAENAVAALARARVAQEELDALWTQVSSDPSWDAAPVEDAAALDDEPNVTGPVITWTGNGPEPDILQALIETPDDDELEPETVIEDDEPAESPLDDIPDETEPEPDVLPGRRPRQRKSKYGGN